MSMKNSNDTTGNRTRDLPACSSVPQPTAAPRAPMRKDKRRDKKIGGKNIDDFFNDDGINGLLIHCK